MLTRFNDVYDFEKEFQAIVAQDAKYKGESTEVKVFIPALMPNIMQGAAGYSRVNNRGCKKVFANAKGTEPQIYNNFIEEKNYLIARIDPNSNINENYYDPESEIDESIDFLRDLFYSYSSSPDALDELEEEENDRSDLHMNNTIYGIDETEMHYNDSEEEKKNIIKKGTNVRCNFFNAKASKLYLKSAPKKE